MLMLLIFILILLFCSIYTFVSNFFVYEGFWKYLLQFLINPYASGIIYTVALVIIVFETQIIISRKYVKKDFRCNEILKDVYGMYVKFYELIANHKDKNDSKNFIIEHRLELKIINLAFCYSNNRILFNSLKATFFFNINFKLLGILNNIENRLPNLTEKNLNVLNYINEKTNDVSFSEHDADYYLVDLKFMAIYWKRLFDYLKYDDLYSNILAIIYNDLYRDDSICSLDVLNCRFQQIDKQYRRKIKRLIKQRKKEHKI